MVRSVVWYVKKQRADVRGAEDRIRLGEDQRLVESHNKYVKQESLTMAPSLDFSSKKNTPGRLLHGGMKGFMQALSRSLNCMKHHCCSRRCQWV